MSFRLPGPLEEALLSLTELAAVLFWCWRPRRPLTGLPRRGLRPRPFGAPFPFLNGPEHDGFLAAKSFCAARIFSRSSLWAARVCRTLMGTMGIGLHFGRVGVAGGLFDALALVFEVPRLEREWLLIEEELLRCDLREDRDAPLLGFRPRRPDRECGSERLCPRFSLERRPYR